MKDVILVTFGVIWKEIFQSKYYQKLMSGLTAHAYARVYLITRFRSLTFAVELHQFRLAITCSKLTIETLEQRVKYVQS